jgi:hypothetical protein
MDGNRGALQLAMLLLAGRQMRRRFRSKPKKDACVAMIQRCRPDASPRSPSVVPLVSLNTLDCSATVLTKRRAVVSETSEA